MREGCGGSGMARAKGDRCRWQWRVRVLTCGCVTKAQLGRWRQCLCCMACMRVQWQYGVGMDGVPLW